MIFSAPNCAERLSFAIWLTRLIKFIRFACVSLRPRAHFSEIIFATSPSRLSVLIEGRFAISMSIVRRSIKAEIFGIKSEIL